MLSLLALALGSCGSSDSDDGGGPVGGGGGDTVYTGRWPVSMMLVERPSRVERFEGQDVDLTSAVFMVGYNNGDRGYVQGDAVRNLTVVPHIYDRGIWNAALRNDAANGVYEIYYREGGVVSSAQVWATDLGTSIAPLISVHYTGSLEKQTYYVDEVPDFRGVTVEGVYGASSALPEGGEAGSEYDHRHRPLTVTNRNEWRWVWNIYDGYAQQAYGILVKIGSYGNLLAAENWSPTPGDPLTGLRIPVGQIYQVDSLSFETPPAFGYRSIFFDDPSLIGEAMDVQEWQKMLEDVVLQVAYSGDGGTKQLSVRDGMTYGLWGGMWARSEEEGDLEMYIQEGTSVVRMDHLVAPYRTGARIGAGMPAGATWQTWSQHRDPRIVFTYRGKKVAAQVPVYAILRTVTAVAKDGELVIMDGESRAYRRPDLFGTFQGRVTVSATYSQRSGDSTATREDVGADFGKQPRQVRGTLPGATNFTKLDAAGRDVSRTGPQAYFSPSIAIATDELDNDVLTTNILTWDNSRTYMERSRATRATVTFTATGADLTGGTALNAETVQQQRSATVNVGVMNYGEEDEA